MASTFSTNLAIELIGTGDQAGTWGTTTNSNLGTLIEQAISGYVTQAVATGTDTTITIPNGATGVARNMYIELTGTGGTNTNLIVPANKKLYFIFNNSTGAVTVKVSGQTGVSVPTGKKMVLVSNGTDIVNGLNYIADFGTNSFSVTNLTASSGTITNLIATSGSITNLVSSDASATVLRAGSATLTHLSATSASITNLSLTSLTISSLSITNVSVASATVSSNLTLSGGTANGVLYLNGSKVATSGTALAFDGTNLTVPAEVYRSSDSSYLRLAGGNPAATGASVLMFGSTHATAAGRLALNTSGTGYMEFSLNSSEAMRLTTTGLGIGTASPVGKLQVTGSLASFILNTSGTEFYNNYAGQVKIYTSNAAGFLSFGSGGRDNDVVLSTTGNLGIGTASPAYKLDVTGTSTTALSAAGFTNNSSANNTTKTVGITFRLADTVGVIKDSAYITAFPDGANVLSAGVAFSTRTGDANPTEKMRLDSSGNLGLGVTPTNNTLGKTLQVGQAGAWVAESGSNRWWLASNWYYNSGDKYINNGFATLYSQQSGQHQWLTAASGTAGNAISFTQAMTLDASGNLLVGKTSSTGIGTQNIEVSNASSSTVAIKGGSNEWSMLVSSSSDSLRFYEDSTERARITSGGELLVGTTATNSGARLDVKGVDSTASNYCVFFENSSSNLLLAVQNDGRWRSGTAAASPYNFVVGATNRDLFVDNAGEIGYVSSVRASKTNIAPVADTNWLLQLNPVTFNFRKRDEDGNYTDEADGPIKHGLIAEEVESVNSDLCFYDDEDKGGALRGVNYSHLITPMLKLIQKQQAAIAALEAKVAALESK